MKSKKKNRKNIIIIECIIIVIFVALLIVSIKENSKEKENIAKDNIMGSQVEEQNDINTYVVDITETENTVEENNSQNQETNNSQKQENNNSSNQNKNNNLPYYIKVNYGAQVVSVYSKDGDGNYTVLKKTMVCSTGTHTPKSGVYAIPGRWSWGALQGNVYGQYVTKITGNILFHSVPYTKMYDPASLEYWEYDKLGTAASLGCVRLKVEDAKWIYDNCSNGTKVEFYSSSDPGPFGKPLSKKITDYPDYLRKWDPTDPNPNNPWKNYKEEPKQENTTVNNETIEVLPKENTVTENKTEDKVENKVEDTKNETVNIVTQDKTTINETNEKVNSINDNELQDNTVENHNNSVNDNSSSI